MFLEQEKAGESDIIFFYLISCILLLPSSNTYYFQVCVSCS